MFPILNPPPSSLPTPTPHIVFQSKPHPSKLLTWNTSHVHALQPTLELMGSTILGYVSERCLAGPDTKHALPSASETQRNSGAPHHPHEKIRLYGSPISLLAQREYSSYWRLALYSSLLIRAYFPLHSHYPATQRLDFFFFFFIFCLIFPRMPQWAWCFHYYFMYPLLYPTPLLPDITDIFGCLFQSNLSLPCSHPNLIYNFYFINSISHHWPLSCANLLTPQLSTFSPSMLPSCTCFKPFCKFMSHIPLNPPST